MGPGALDGGTHQLKQLRRAGVVDNPDPVGVLEGNGGHKDMRLGPPVREIHGVLLGRVLGDVVRCHEDTPSLLQHGAQDAGNEAPCGLIVAVIVVVAARKSDKSQPTPH